MKPHGKKALACISLVLLVLSIIPSGALSNETGTQNPTDASGFADGRSKGKGPLERPAEVPEFETEEEEMAFLKERAAESIQKRIEMAEKMLENFDETDNENVTAESLKEELSKLEALLEDINDATALEELRELMSENMKMGRGNEMQGKGPGRGMPSFETEEEELEFAKTRTLESVERMIETLENTTLEETDSDNINSEDVEALLVQLEDIKTKLNSEELTLEDIKEIRENISGIMDSIREILPVPANERGHAPGPRGNQGEATA